MSLQNQLYQLKLEMEKMKDERAMRPSPAPSAKSAGAKSNNLEKESAPSLQTDPSYNLSKTSQSRMPDSGTKLDDQNKKMHTQISYDNPEGMEDVSQMRRQFDEAFGGDEPSFSEQNERIKQLED